MFPAFLRSETSIRFFFFQIISLVRSLKYQRSVIFIVVAAMKIRYYRFLYFNVAVCRNIE